MASLSARLLLAVSLLLLVFFGATIVVLDSAFREAGEQAEEDILDGQLIALFSRRRPERARRARYAQRHAGTAIGYRGVGPVCRAAR